MRYYRSTARHSRENADVRAATAVQNFRYLPVHPAWQLALIMALLVFAMPGSAAQATAKQAKAATTL